MIVLFAPSESKQEGGNLSPLEKESLFFADLYHYRLEAIEKYEHFILNASEPELSKLFGIKEQKEYAKYLRSFREAKTMKAIERYNGVAYEYLDYSTLNQQEQKYIDDNVIIFSNLFGPLRASDRIPDYKVKQSEEIDGFNLEKHYQKYFTDAIGNCIGNDEVLDLRAGFYEKFYVHSTPVTTMKFLRDGKVVSHWAKAYRGLVLRTAAKGKVQSIDELLAMEISGLKLEEIHELKKKKEIIYTIL